MYCSLGQDKEFLRSVCEKRLHLPKWEYMQVGQIAVKIDKQTLANELQRMLVERNQDSDGALVVNGEKNLADVCWYETFIYTLDNQHRFFDRVSNFFG